MVPIHLLLYRDYLMQIRLRRQFPDMFSFFDNAHQWRSSDIRTFSEMNEKRVWIGAEHPKLGCFLAHMIDSRRLRNVLEVGYQSGGSSIPIIKALAVGGGGTYIGMDNEENDYAKGSHLLIEEYLRKTEVVNVQYMFMVGDAMESLRSVNVKFDMVFIDHAKHLYEPTLKLILERGLCHEKTIFLFHDVYNYAREFMPSIYSHFAVHFQIPQIREGIAVCLHPKS